MTIEDKNRTLLQWCICYCLENDHMTYDRLEATVFAASRSIEQLNEITKEDIRHECAVLIKMGMIEPLKYDQKEAPL